MPSTIVLNQSNIVPDGQNNKMVYQFPNSVQFPSHEIAVQSITMYYSWSNINSTTLNNNVFTYKWTFGTTTNTYTVTIPAGLYEIASINQYFQFVCIQNGTYLINSAGRNVYYAEFLVNPNRYAIQVNTFPVPTTLPTGWSVPVASTASGTAGWVGFPTTTFNPSLTFPANFCYIVGYAPNFSTSSNTGVGTNLSYLSSTAPQVQPNSSVYVSISNIQNKYAVPNSIIYSLSPSVAFGEQIAERPPQFAWNKLLSGTYNELRLTFLGIDKSPIPILDPTMTVILVIRDTKDLGIQDLVSNAAGGK